MSKLIERERIDQLEEALHTAGMALAVAAKWPRVYFNRLYLEDHAIRAAHILIDGKPDNRDTRFEAEMVRANSSHSMKRSPLSSLTFEDVRAWPQTSSLYRRTALSQSDKTI